MDVPVAGVPPPPPSPPSSPPHPSEDSAGGQRDASAERPTQHLAAGHRILEPVPPRIVGHAAPLLSRAPHPVIYVRFLPGSGPRSEGPRLGQGPDRVLDGGDQRARGDELLGGGEIGRDPAVGPRTRHAARSARTAAAVPAAGASGARRSSPCAAQTSSTARMRRRLATPRAACARRPSPSRRGPPASRSSAASRPTPARPGGGSRRPSPPACTARA